MSLKEKARDLKEDIKDKAKDIKHKIEDKEEKMQEKAKDMAKEKATKIGVKKAEKKWGLESEDNEEDASGPIYEIIFRIIKNRK